MSEKGKAGSEGRHAGLGGREDDGAVGACAPRDISHMISLLASGV